MIRYILIIILFTSCSTEDKPKTVVERSLVIENPKLAYFKYADRFSYDYFIDSSHKYKVGDTLK